MRYMWNKHKEPLYGSKLHILQSAEQLLASQASMGPWVRLRTTPASLRTVADAAVAASHSKAVGVRPEV